MMFQPPQRSSDQEIAEARRLGQSRIGGSSRRPTIGQAAVTVAWIGGLILIAWVLIGLGLIDPDFCRGTANPASC